jgi:thiol-disulfide isomerase/thioredoxin
MNFLAFSRVLPRRCPLRGSFRRRCFRPEFGGSSLLAIVGALVIAVAPVRAQVRVGDFFPDLTSAGAGVGAVQPAPAVAGGAAMQAAQPAGGALGDAVDVAVAQVRGKVALIDFWASWCPPCKASFPAYGRIYAEYGPRGLGLLAVSVDEKAGAYAEFVKRLAPPFAVVRDANQSLVQRVQVPTMPTSYLLDRTGRVRYVHPGFRGPETEAAMRKEIETLLAEPAS